MYYDLDWAFQFTLLGYLLGSLGAKICPPTHQPLTSIKGRGASSLYTKLHN
jgi:hypothetical protein